MSEGARPAGGGRFRVFRGFLWLAVLGWGIGLGAKLFDLLVVARAWSADPPASFALLPYGPRYPLDPGDFFIPLSAVMATTLVGALVAGRRAPRRPRLWLWVAALAFLLIWIATPTVFWPMVGQLQAAVAGRFAGGDAEAVALARRWMLWDSARTVVIALGYVAVVRAISLPAGDGGAI